METGCPAHAQPTWRSSRLTQMSTRFSPFSFSYRLKSVTMVTYFVACTFGHCELPHVDACALISVLIIY